MTQIQLAEKQESTKPPPLYRSEADERKALIAAILAGLLVTIGFTVCGAQNSIGSVRSIVCFTVAGLGIVTPPIAFKISKKIYNYLTQS